MTQLKILGAAALLASALATPAMAQQAIGTPARCSNANPDARCQTVGPGYAGTTYRERSTQRDRDWQDRDWQRSYNRYDPGPADVAAGVVGGAVGTAAAIATAPFRGPDYYARGGEDYAQRNGFVCTPGTWFRGSDGLRHPCQ
ncbi:hypothetical protein IC762_22430 [Bradyrhizobium genosp. L]|uniref:hypothetical protein n=1 Tax=Bradyrhizobium genosp. L TaxID=83637 RepID=UPI0018A261AB|nr:hypothetical protein [Bradyrhizobium genosp. L]QPF82506.1 hypothetical protein IC762_22430 [Bradyrhizobium genosp. L]